jgi:GNAT superfamily N-acetyltransferase
MNLREATPDDAEAVVALYDWLFAPPGSVPPRWDPVAAQDRVRQLVAGPRSVVLLAEDEGSTVGFCTIAVDLLSVRFGPRAWVEDLAVDPAHRSAGVGKALLDAAKAWAAGIGASHLELDSGDARVDAHRFYDREQPAWTSRCYAWQLPPAGSG